MEKTSINEQGGDVNHMTGIPLFTVRLFKRRIRDCPNIEIGKNNNTNTEHDKN